MTSPSKGKCMPETGQNYFFNLCKPKRRRSHFVFYLFIWAVDVGVGSVARRATQQITVPNSSMYP